MPAEEAMVGCDIVSVIMPFTHVHRRRPGVVAILLYPWPIVSVKLGIEHSSNCAIIAIDFASRYCFSC